MQVAWSRQRIDHPPDNQYTDNSTIYLEVKKDCSATTASSEHVNYQIDGHL